MQSDLLVILNALAEPVFLVSAERKILLANTAAAALFGDDLVGKDFVHAIRHPSALTSIEKALAGEPPSETTIVLPLPVQATYKLSSVAVRNDADSELKVVVSLNDISNILEAEQMRSEFVANVSHELRSPLTALIGGIETLQGPARNDHSAQDHFLNIMERESARMNRLVGDLLSLSRVEGNENIRPSERVNVQGVVERVVAAMETQSDAAKKPIRLQKLDSGGEVSGDTDELTQVFQNLIDNALKYSRDGSQIEVTISRRDRPTGMDHPALVIEIADQGDGIPSEHIPRLTERFYRVDDSRSVEKGGTGLGLAIVKHIVNRHRGKLQIDSEIGVGSRFTVFLPLDRDTPNPTLS